MTRTIPIHNPNRVPNFEDLEFKAHTILGATQAELVFTNGYGVSVVGGGYGLYGDSITTWEVAVTHQTDNQESDLCYNTPITNDVEGWCDKKRVEEIMQETASLPVNTNCTHNHK